MFWNIKPSLAIVNVPPNKRSDIEKSLTSYVYRITFLDSIEQKTLYSANPDILLFFPTASNETLLRQIRHVRKYPFYFRSIAILIINEIDFMQTRIFIEEGFDFILPQTHLGNLPAVIDIYTDICEYRILHDASTWEKILSLLDIPVVICNIEGIIQYSNTHFRQFVSNTNQKIANLSIYDFLLPENEILVRDKTRDALRQESHIQKIPIALTKGFSGNLYYSLLSISWFPRVTKNELSVLYAFHEYSEIKKTKEKVTLLQSILDKSSSSILITNAKGTIMYANPSQLEKWMTQESNIVGESVSSLPPLYRLPDRKDAQPYTRLGFTFFHKHEIVTKEGSLVVEKEKIFPVLYDSEKENGFLVRVAEYSREENTQKGKQRNWIQEIFTDISREMDTLGTDSSEFAQKETKHNLSRLFEILQENFYISSQEQRVFRNCDLNQIIQHVIHSFFNQTHALSTRFQENLPSVFIDEIRIRFVLLVILTETFRKDPPCTISLNTSLHRDGVQLIIRTIFSTTKEDRDQETDFLWIIQQSLALHSTNFTVHKEFSGESIFIVFQTTNEYMECKIEEIEGLL